MDSLLHIGLSNALVASLLALLVAAASAFCRRPALTHALWLLVLIKLITPPLFSIPVSWSTQTDAASVKGTEVAATARSSLSVLDWPDGDMASTDDIAQSDKTPPVDAAPSETTPLLADSRGPAQPLLSPSEETSAGPVTEVDRTETVSRLGKPIAAVAWLAGTLIWLVILVARGSRFRAVGRWARPAPADVVGVARELAARLGLRQCPAIAFLPARVSPLLGGLGWRPVLFLPEELWQRLSHEQRATLLAHELAHLRRHDRWVRALEVLATGLYWWHPVVWWARRELREAEEQCCDAWVVSLLPRATRAYATALVETLDFLAEDPLALPVAASGLGPIHDLRRRLTMIMRGGTPRSLSSAGFFLVVALGAILLPLVPSWAQQLAPPRPDREQAPPGAVQDNTEVPALESPPRPEGARDRDEVGRASNQVRESQRQVERARAELRRAEQRLAEARTAEEQDRLAQAGRSLQYGGQHPGQPRSPEDLGARLDQVEHKLDAVLEELHSLRRELRRGPSAPGVPGGPPGYGPARFGPAGGARPGEKVYPPGAVPALPSPAGPGVAPPAAAGAPAPPATPPLPDGGAGAAPPAVEVPEAAPAAPSPTPGALPGEAPSPPSPPPPRSTPPAPGRSIGI
jgi:beta-lactamase regulating signal transducer with metallopeptidase domain